MTIDTNTEHFAIGRAIDEACQKLPDGWTLYVEIERGDTTMELRDDAGQHDYPFNYGRLSDEIRDAVEYARALKEPT